jgi:hypothetical protein
MGNVIDFVYQIAKKREGVGRRFLGEKMLPVNVTIYVLNLTRAESPIFDTMDNSPSSTIREILVVAVLPRHARFFWG